MDESGLLIDDLRDPKNTAGLPDAGEAAADENRELFERVLSSIGAAVRAVERSQHRDGGWGTQVEQSNFWHTAYSVMFLRAVRNLPMPDEAAEASAMLERAMAYLELHTEHWATDVLFRIPALSIYDTGLMGRCFYRIGRAYVRRETALRIYRSIDRLYHSQNPDGGWDAKLWGYEVKTPTYLWSEVGATSIVLQALAETREQRFEVVSRKGMEWLSAAQNADGSWNNGSCRPDLAAYQISGWPTVNKTCDALQGILVGQALEIPLDPFRRSIDLGINWLRGQVSPVVNGHCQAGGFSAVDYETICLTLETLLLLPDADMVELSRYASWLLCVQRHQEGDAADGAWVLGHTARIGLALAQFYSRANPAASRAADHESPLPWIL